MSLQSKYLAKVLGFTVQGANKWKREKEERPIGSLLEKYFTEDDLEEFLTTGKMTKLEEKEDSYLTFMLIDYVKHNLKEKLDRLLLKSNAITFLEKYIPKKIFINILKEISNDPKLEIEKYKAKKYLIEKIESYKVTSISNPKKKQLIDTITKNFSNIECYVLIKYSEEFLENK